MSERLYADIVESLLWRPDNSGGIIPFGRREAEAIAPWISIMIERARQVVEDERDDLRQEVAALKSEVLAARTDRAELADELQTLRDWRDRLIDGRVS